MSKHLPLLLPQQQALFNKPELRAFVTNARTNGSQGISRFAK
jgi:hypothetical protein